MAKSRSRAGRERAEAPRFIEVWQTSSTRREVESRLGMTKAAVRTRACRYRELGVPLKDLPPDGMFGWSWKWDVLAENARRILKEYEEDETSEGASKGHDLSFDGGSEDGESRGPLEAAEPDVPG